MTKKTTTKTAKKKTVKKTVKRLSSAAKKVASAKKTTRKVAARKSSAVQSTKKAAKKTIKKMAAKTTKTTPAKTAGSKTTKQDQKKVAAPVTGRRRRRQTVAEAVVAAETDRDGYVIVNGRRIRRITVDPSTTVKKRSARVTKQATQKVEAKIVKSPLSRKELNAFKRLLIAKRLEVLQALDSMETQALRSDTSDASSMPIHMADVGSDAYEQDLKLGISASERERIRDIDLALHRIKDGVYGVCESTAKPIRMSRLEAKPWARYTIEAARKLEPRRRR